MPREGITILKYKCSLHLRYTYTDRYELVYELQLYCMRADAQGSIQK